MRALISLLESQMMSIVKISSDTYLLVLALPEEGRSDSAYSLNKSWLVDVDVVFSLERNQK
jgi:hypothetical protein